VRIILAPALVQGDGAVGSLLSALDRLERVPEVEVIVIGRGGGSAEDLQAFSDERLVRRLARVRVPVVSAVGHEIDTSLSDLVADARAATPSQAAELLVSDEQVKERELSERTIRLRRALAARLTEQRLLLARVHRKLGDPRVAVFEWVQHVDELSARLHRSFRGAIHQRERDQGSLAGRLRAAHPQAVLLRARAQLLPLSVRLRGAGRRVLSEREAELQRCAQALTALSPLLVLTRGYSLTLLPDGSALRRPAEAPPGTLLTVRVEHGTVRARVESSKSGWSFGEEPPGGVELPERLSDDAPAGGREIVRVRRPQ